MERTEQMYTLHTQLDFSKVKVGAPTPPEPAPRRSGHSLGASASASPGPFPHRGASLVTPAPLSAEAQLCRPPAWGLSGLCPHPQGCPEGLPPARAPRSSLRTGKGQCRGQFTSWASLSLGRGLDILQALRSPLAKSSSKRGADGQTLPHGNALRDLARRQLCGPGLRLSSLGLGCRPPEAAREAGVTEGGHRGLEKGVRGVWRLPHDGLRSPARGQ